MLMIYVCVSSGMWTPKVCQQKLHKHLKKKTKNDEIGQMDNRDQGEYIFFISFKRSNILFRCLFLFFVI